MSLENIKQALRTFVAAHPNERFYSLRIDANSIGLNSEERFEATRKEYADRWEQEHQPFDLAALRKVSGRKLEDDFTTSTA